MQCMHCLCSTKLCSYFLLWWCIVMYAILGFTVWYNIEGDPLQRNSSPSDAFLSYLSYSKSPSQPGQKFGIVFLAIHTTYFVLCVPCFLNVLQSRVGSNALWDEFGMWRCKVIQFVVIHNSCVKSTTTCTTYHPTLLWNKTSCSHGQPCHLPWKWIFFVSKVSCKLKMCQKSAFSRPWR